MNTSLQTRTQSRLQAGAPALGRNLARLTTAVGLILGLGFGQIAYAATYSAESNLTTVDTRGRLLTVSGRVRHSEREHSTRRPSLPRSST